MSGPMNSGFLSDTFSFQRGFDTQSLSAEPAVEQSTYSKTFGIFSDSVLCSVVSGPKVKAATYFMFPLFFLSHLKDPRHFLSGFLLSTMFFLI